MRYSYLPSTTRWIIALAIIVIFLVFAQASNRELDAPLRLGLETTTTQSGQSVVSWVYPAGTAWDDGIRPGQVVISANATPIQDATIVHARSPDGAIITTHIDTSDWIRGP